MSLEVQRIDAPSFWQWAFSDFLSNALRGVLAEYIVGKALGALREPRVEWDACDMTTDDGFRVEVKSSAYLQSWQQKKPSTIRFDIGEKRAWESQTNDYTASPVRMADIYVFCVFTARSREQADPLALNQWFFLVCSTRLLNERLGGQKTVGLAPLEQMGLSRVPYEALARSVQAVRTEIMLAGTAG